MTLTSTNVGGSDIESKTSYITVSEAPPVAGFSGKPTTGTVPLTVAFSDESSGMITSYLWDFGDTATSTEQSPSHEYTTASTYTVRLTVNGPGGSDIKTITDYITVNPVNHAPVATADSYSTNKNTALVVPASGVLANDNDVDGNPITAIKVTDPTNGVVTLNSDGRFTYTPTANYVGSDFFMYKANDGYLDSDSVMVSIIISEPLPVKPIAAFDATPNYLTVKFTDKSANTPTSWSWNFGDRKTSTEQNPTHKYTKVGSYPVTLAVKNAAGTDTTTKTITVMGLVEPTAAFHSDVTTGSAPLTVQFYDDSMGSTPFTYSWNFGDKKKSTEQNPSHTYTRAGSYTVILTVKNAAGSSTFTGMNYISVK